MERSEKPDTKKPVIDRLFGMPKASCILYKIHLKTNLPEQGRSGGAASAAGAASAGASAGAGFVMDCQ